MPFKMLISLLIPLSLTILIWQGMLYRQHLRFVPENIGIWRVLYAAEEVWGFGPGGNESGIIVYAMPGRATHMLFLDGLEWLDTLGRNSLPGSKERYAEWRETPVPASAFRADSGTCPPARADRMLFAHNDACPGIAGYMERYGLAIPLDKDIEEMVNRAVFSPRAYYAYGRTGLIILIPTERRVVYVYAG